QRDVGDAGEALEIEADDGVIAHRGVGVDLDGGDHLLGIMPVELQVGHFADAHAVEEDARAVAQTADRPLEHDVVAGADLAFADRAEPVHEGETRCQHAEREEADQDVVRFGFHSLTLPELIDAPAGAPYLPPATACRGSIPSPMDDRTRASRPSGLPRLPGRPRVP